MGGNRGGRFGYVEREDAKTAGHKETVRELEVGGGSVWELVFAMLFPWGVRRQRAVRLQ